MKAPVPRLEMEVRGSGPRVVLIHGSVIGVRTFAHQASLADTYEVVLADRPGFGASPPIERGDFEAEAPLFASLLGDGAHLVGHSYGAVIALYAAALAPRSVRSLVISEPGCLAVAAGDPAVDAQIAGGMMLYARAEQLTARDFLLAFRGGAGSTHATPPELEGELLAGAELLRRERPPWEAEPDFGVLARAPFPKLVISGGHSQVFEAVCDQVAARLGGERAVIPGRGHSVPATGEPYTQRLREFLAGAGAQ
ncbi:MAG TPA: alpha/beta hydrolase [Solirubrobacteraceae bacterium]|jgi:pimeloyl-ACP methyl ester carboxylesterase|nr:alpha/beta hydrolase [Solirubrobacteraceae bacterium]